MFIVSIVIFKASSYVREQVVYLVKIVDDDVNLVMDLVKVIFFMEMIKEKRNGSGIIMVAEVGYGELLIFV